MRTRCSSPKFSRQTPATTRASHRTSLAATPASLPNSSCMVTIAWTFVTPSFDAVLLCRGSRLVRLATVLRMQRHPVQCRSSTATTHLSESADDHQSAELRWRSDAGTRMCSAVHQRCLVYAERVNRDVLGMVRLCRHAVSNGSSAASTSLHSSFAVHRPAETGTNVSRAVLLADSESLSRHVFELDGVVTVPNV